MSKKKSKHLEIERRFLLKSIPNVKYNTVLQIEQYYCEGGYRARCAFNLTKYYNTGKKKMKYISTLKKKPLNVKLMKNKGKGVNIEIEGEMSKAEFKTMLETATLIISKQRHIKKKDGLTWEVDVFTGGMSLVIAEVELKRVNQKVVIPKFIKDNLIMEVTGIKRFTNRSLAVKI